MTATQRMADARRTRYLALLGLAQGHAAAAKKNLLHGTNVEMEWPADYSDNERPEDVARVTLTVQHDHARVVAVFSHEGLLSIQMSSPVAGPEVATAIANLTLATIG